MKPYGNSRVAVLNEAEMCQLNVLASDLAERAFGGQARVERAGDGFVRLTLVKRADGGGGRLSVRAISASSYATAAQEILRAVHSAAAER
jgi:hypothetical protein